MVARLWILLVLLYSLDLINPLVISGSHQPQLRISEIYDVF